MTNWKIENADNVLIQGDKINCHFVQGDYTFLNYYPEMRVVPHSSYGFLGVRSGNLYSSFMTHSVLGRYEMNDSKRKRKVNRGLQESVE